ncbi:hypothetical protein FHT40_006279 [Mycolicibacterium sp. BK556]|nr:MULTISPECIES: hypothetical protein [Mycobacteriaceae]MBB3606588.1 hypothetical protein [Mycolicibacterium sp. BK556]MBB3636166.1 hypothetical protein [Mycolicibacterium sp. BK607]
MAELLPVPRLEDATAKEPFVANTLVRVEVRQCHVKPVLRVEYVMLGAAVDHTVRAVIVVEFDGMVSNQVHRAVEFAENMVVERLHSVTSGPVTAIVDVLDKERGDAVDILAIDRYGIPIRQLMNLVARDHVVESARIR